MTTPPASQTVTLADVHAAINRAADEITDAAELPDVGTRDALNLLVNATLHYLTHPGAGLAEVVEVNYVDTRLGDVLRWIDESNPAIVFREG